LSASGKSSCFKCFNPSIAPNVPPEEAAGNPYYDNTQSLKKRRARGEETKRPAAAYCHDPVRKHPTDSYLAEAK
jgi:hypothetical protein